MTDQGTLSFIAGAESILLARGKHAYDTRRSKGGEFAHCVVRWRAYVVTCLHALLLCCVLHIKRSSLNHTQ